MCDEREQVLDYLYDECEPAGRRRVEAHLGECESCRDELRGWRSVRTDLLAWDVPEQPSVWTPFAPPRVAPWYRQVPAWAMAAAATLVFAIGAAGGFVARTASTALSAERGAPSAAQIPAMSEQQIRDIVRTEAQAVALSVVQPIAAHQVDEPALMRRMSALVSNSEARMSQKQGAQTVAFYQDSENQRKQDLNNLNMIFDARMKGMSYQITGEVLKTVNRALTASQPDANKKER